MTRGRMPIAWTIRRHTLAWVGLAGFALAYLTGLYLFYASETMSGGASAGLSADGKNGDLATANIESLRKEIAVLRRQFERMERRGDDFAERLSAVEAAFGPHTASLPAQDDEAAIASGARRNAIARSAPSHAPVTVTYAALPEDGFGDLMINRSPLPVANSSHATRTMFGVELATGTSAEALQKKWAELGARHKGLLGGLRARHQESMTEKQTRRLIAGPFTNAAEAAQLCASLRAAGTECRQTVFAGEGFQ